MTVSYYNGLNGMKTSQVGIDVLGENIANINTTGYKQQQVDYSSGFGSMLTVALNSDVSSEVGLISTATSTSMDLTQGSIQSTDNVFDLALQGEGWMSVKDMNGQTYYTRTGSFTRDMNGTLVTQSGDKLQVVNANNLTFDGENWKFDSTIDTNNLVNDSAQTSSINLPNNVIFPAQPTQKVSLAGNLPNEAIAPNPKPAINSSDVGVLYDTNAQNMNMRYGEDVVFGFGKDVSYEDGLVRYDICIPNDVEDSQDMNIDFDVNGVNIKLTMPDGSSSQEISDAIAQKLDENNILYEKTDNSIEIKDKNKLFITSNSGDLISSNSAIERLTYNDNNQDENFTTIQDFIDKLQNMADFTYQDKAVVGLDDEGKLYIQNNTDNMDLVASSFATDNSNNMFMSNLDHLGNIIKPNTASNSLEFNQNYQGFTGDIIDANGNKNDLKFDFYKTKVVDNNTIWNLTISEIKDGEVISSQSQDLTFDNLGGLLDPTNITFNNNGIDTNIDLGGNFLGITSTDKSNTGFIYSQDGFLEGNLVDYNIGENGEIIANFSNSKSGVLGQVPIYHFQNEQGLDSIGSNKYTVTDNSGQAFLYKDMNDDYLTGATVTNYALENSNVDMAMAMSELIVMQKAFESNSKALTTSDQMVQKAIDMKR